MDTGPGGQLVPIRVGKSKAGTGPEIAEAIARILLAAAWFEKRTVPTIVPSASYGPFLAARDAGRTAFPPLQFACGRARPSQCAHRAMTRASSQQPAAVRRCEGRSDSWIPVVCATGS